MTPKLIKIKSDKTKKKYTLKREVIATDVDVALSEVYHQFNKDVEILVKGNAYTYEETPYAYFKYKNKVWPIYVYEPTQCEYIYINGSAYNSESYSLNPVPDFVDAIDYYEKENE